MNRRGSDLRTEANLLLLHQLRIGAIVHHILAEDRSRQGRINLLCIDVFELSIQYELIALRSEADGGLFAEKNKGEYVAILRLSQSPVLVWDVVQSTFSRQEKKNLYGSMPYVTVLPTSGTKWKTTGGSLGFLKNN